MSLPPLLSLSLLSSSGMVESSKMGDVLVDESGIKEKAEGLRQWEICHHVTYYCKLVLLLRTTLVLLRSFVRRN